MAMHVEQDGTVKEGEVPSPVNSPEDMPSRLLAVLFALPDANDRIVATVGTLLCLLKPFMTEEDAQAILHSAWNSFPLESIPMLLSQAFELRLRSHATLNELRAKGAI